MIIMKSVMMMLGELEYNHSYIETADEQHFANTNLVVLLIFAIIMPILLMNLLVGLAIGDLMEIQQNARLKRLAMQVRLVVIPNGSALIVVVLQVQFHTNLEKKIPSKLIQRWFKDELIVYRNRFGCNHLSFLTKRVGE